MVDDRFPEEVTQPIISKEEDLNTGVQNFPSVIGPYKIESFFAKGGMSLLYLATHPDTKKPIVIKVLSTKYISHPEMVSRFLKEARIIEMAKHPNIVKLFGEGPWEEGLYIAMELVQGISIRQLILQNSLSLQRALEIVLEIGEALKHLHTHGVIHRDLKPENILLTEAGGIKVIDFGIAQLREEHETERLTQHKRIMGTPIYMSPEQKSASDAVSYQSDIYSLAMVTYELVLGKLSHGVIQLSLMPLGLRKILEKALRIDPRERYQNIMEFLTAIATYVTKILYDPEIKKTFSVTAIPEFFSKASSLLLAGHPPNWPKVDLNVLTQHAAETASLFYDFFELSDNILGIAFGWSMSKEIENVVLNASLQGMLRALTVGMRAQIRTAESPGQLLMQHLSEACALSNISEKFTFSFLLLFPSKNELRYISCGKGALWLIATEARQPRKLEANNELLGTKKTEEYLELTHNWHIGDALVLTAFSGETIRDEIFHQAISDVLRVSPGKQTELILHKINLQEERFGKNNTLALLSLLRQG